MTTEKIKEMFKYLGHSGVEYDGTLDTIKSPIDIDAVTFETDGFNVGANCPVTGQPDHYHVRIEYTPAGLLVESKSLKLFLQSLAGQEFFGETLTAVIADVIFKATGAHSVRVTTTQAIRGGLTMTTTVTRQAIEFGEVLTGYQAGVSAMADIAKRRQERGR